jgi:hypothetical protein
MNASSDKESLLEIRNDNVAYQLRKHRTEGQRALLSKQIKNLLLELGEVASSEHSLQSLQVFSGDVRRLIIDDNVVHPRVCL